MQKFCEAVVAGKNGLEAYRAAHPGAAYNTAVGAAPKVFKRPEIQAEIARLRALEQQKPGSATMTLIEKRKFLARIVRARIALLPEDSDLWQSVKRSMRGKIFRLPDKLLAIAGMHLVVFSVLFAVGVWLS